ncbi:MAG: DNA mismatch repair protein MutS [Leptospirales bacterium]
MTEMIQSFPPHEYPDTPLFRQYSRLREEVNGSLLLFRLGDFYELFGDQAETVSRVLGLTLTTRDRNRPHPLPMCGIPARSLELYLPRLIYQGFSVGIAEQTTQESDQEGLFQREIVRIVTRSTLIEDPALSGGNTKNGVAIVREGESWAGACLDLSDGKLTVFDPGGKGRKEDLLDWLARKNPEEVIIADESLRSDFCEWEPTMFPVEQAEHWKSFLPSGFQFPDLSSPGIRALALLIGSVAWRQKSMLPHLTGAVLEDGQDVLILDRATLRHLDLLPNAEEKRKPGSLLEVLDRSKTPMGSRTIRRWLLSPDSRGYLIAQRHLVLQYFADHPRFPDDVIPILRSVGDLERILGRISLKGRSPRDLSGLRDGLSGALRLAWMPEWDNFFPDDTRAGILQGLEEIRSLLERALVSEPAVSLGEGPIIQDEFDSDLCRFRKLEQEGDQDLLEIERRERSRTGIENLRLRYNQVSGYFIEVSKGQAKNVPAEYYRKQILTNVERFTVPDLIDFESRIAQARQSVLNREGEIIDSLIDSILGVAGKIQYLSRLVGTIDALQSFYAVSRERGYHLPVFRENGPLEIVNGRHPVLELRLPASRFVPNDVFLDEGDFIVLTGPNMAGKSTYMRQIALLQIMAQAGAPIPADSATLPLVDRILTRVGASDHILEGESTFMVEMKEMSRILNEATARSLVLLDEVGRGTSTFDGMALAWSISEFLHDRIRCRTLFATHYHELYRLSDHHHRIRNHSVAVTVREEGILFHHRIVSGHSSRSYGIDVARLAGVPEVVVERAFEILHFWNKQKLFRSVPEGSDWTPPDQEFSMPIFSWNKKRQPPDPKRSDDAGSLEGS